MAGTNRATAKRRWVGGVVLLGVLVAGIAWAQDFKKGLSDSSANYSVQFVPVEGWKEIPHSPQAIFLYQQPETKMLLRGAVNQVVADFNPTPGLHTDAIADYYIARTRENMPGWTAEKLDRIEAGGTTFRLIRRENPGKIVVTAFAVRGNTTLLVTLSGEKRHSAKLEEYMPEFRRYLTTFQMKRSTADQLFSKRSRPTLL